MSRLYDTNEDYALVIIYIDNNLVVCSNSPYIAQILMVSLFCVDTVCILLYFVTKFLPFAKYEAP